MSETPVESPADSKPGAADSQASKRVLVGTVTGDKMDKTVTVLVERRVKHPLYKKYVRRSTKFHVHDASNDCRVGDLVSIEPCRPLSKTKFWTLERVIERAK